MADKVKFAPYISADLHSRARSLVARLRAQGSKVSLNQLVEDGLRHQVETLEAYLNNGQRFPEVEEMSGHGGRRG